MSPDETSGKVAGRRWWLWAFATATTVVYAIQEGRGFDEAAAVLGADFTGVLVRDGWAPYRQFAHAGHHTCLAHLIRRCREIAEAHPLTDRFADARHVALRLDRPANQLRCRFSANFDGKPASRRQFIEPQPEICQDVPTEDQYQWRVA